MTWTWQLEDASGEPVGRSESFDSRSDAESWVGEVWAELSAAGVDAVTLFEHDREVYGPMSLSA